MHRLRVRLTIRQLMGLIAVVAILAGGFVSLFRYFEMRRLSISYAGKALDFASLEKESSLVADDCEQFLEVSPRPEDFESFLDSSNGAAQQERSNFAYNTLANRMSHVLEMKALPREREVFMDATRAIVARVGPHNRRLAAYYADLRAKYERAASRPWEPVAGDPPPPEP